MNPAIDIGRVEGGIVRSTGYLWTEKRVFEAEGDEKRRLNVTHTWRCKIPAATIIPLRMNTYLFPRDHVSVKSIGEDSNEFSPRRKSASRRWCSPTVCSSPSGSHSRFPDRTQSRTALSI
ncbi:MAG: hypothetical protein V4719_26170 [Planctomycetota bacterium]